MSFVLSRAHCFGFLFAVYIYVCVCLGQSISQDIDQNTKKKTHISIIENNVEKEKEIKPKEERNPFASYL